MAFFVSILLALVLICITYQDLKQRSIHVVLPVLLFVLALLYNYYAPQLVLNDTLYNIGFILINIAGLFLYYSLKNKTFHNPIDHQIGLGDIAFFFAVTPLFNLKTFVLYFVFSLVVSLLIHIIANSFFEVKTIPLAGYMSLCLLGYLLFLTFKVMPVKL